MKKVLFCLLTLFLLSVVIRIPNINRSLSDRHEWLTAHTLITFQIWYEKGISNYKYNLIETYPHIQDKNITFVSGITDKGGDFYYISYPPFALYFPYFIFNLLHIYPDVLPLQIFNLVLHFVCCIFVYLIISLLYDKKLKNGIFAPAIIGTVCYMFIPQNLWYHSNVYFSEIAVQVFWIIEIYIVLYLIKNPFFGKKMVFLLGIVSFLSSYTEWIGVIFSLFAVVVFFIHSKKNPRYFILIKTIFTSVLSALFFTVFQYSQINGFQNFISPFIERFLSLNGYGNSTRISFFSISWYREMCNLYWEWYLLFLVLLILYLMILFILKIKSGKIFFNKLEVVLLLIVFGPVILHHLIFPVWTTRHLFSILKSSVGISILFGIIAFKLLCITKKKVFYRYLFLIFTSLVIVVSLGKYIQMHNPLKNDSKMEYLGEQIRKNSHDDELVVVTGNISYIEPQIVFYARRNIARSEKESDAVSHMSKFGKNKAVIYTVDQNWNIVKTERVAL
jgi:hypothetical protein